MSIRAHWKVFMILEKSRKEIKIVVLWRNRIVFFTGKTNDIFWPKKCCDFQTQSITVLKTIFTYILIESLKFLRKSIFWGGEKGRHFKLDENEVVWDRQSWLRWSVLNTVPVLIVAVVLENAVSFKIKVWIWHFSSGVNNSWKVWKGQNLRTPPSPTHTFFAIRLMKIKLGF